MVRAAVADSAGDTEERILVAALAAFSEKGYEGATTREIAAQADVTLGLLQYYFGGKLKLWRAAVDRAFAELELGLDAVMRDVTVVDGRERMRLLIHNYVRFVARNPEFVRLMHEEGKRRGPRMRWLVDRHVKPMYAAISALVVSAQERGILPTEIAPVHFHYLLAGTVGVIFHQAEECKRLTGIDPFEEKVVEAHARAVEFFLLGPDPKETTP
jgi:AcrR family transcriptional regulator